jgi:hypothetical protein
VSGSGSTDGAINGKGNLIIGYNLDDLTGSGIGGDDATDTRTGSHNLVVGDDHTYSSFGGVVFGWNSSITNEWAAVTGGRSNTASGGNSSVTGGYANTASGTYSSVSGGWIRSALGLFDWRAGSLYENE